MLSDRMFLSMLPLNDRELCLNEDSLVFVSGGDFYSQIIAYLFSCKELCQDSKVSIIGTFIYFNHQLL